MARDKYLFLLFLLTLSFNAYSQSRNGVVDEVVWIVGDDAILRSDVEKRRVEFGNSVAGNPYCSIPEQMAIQKLFLHQAVIDSIEVTDEEVNTYVEPDLNEKVLMAGSKEKLEEYMRMSMSQIREEIFHQYQDELTVMKVRESLTADVKVTPAEVRNYLKGMPEDSLPLIPTQVEVQLLVLQPRIPQEEIERLKAELREYADRVNNGTTSFSTLARLYSEDAASARQGGELPYMGKAELDPAFANVAFSLTEPDKVSKVVQSDFGYHIIQLLDKRGDKIKCRHILRRPQIAQIDIDTAMAHLDSITADIKDKRISFEDAVRYASDDKDTRNNYGILSNQKSNREYTTRFEMGELSARYSELARVVETLEPGEISAPFTMMNSKGMKVCAVARLKTRIPAHRANIAEDFQSLKSLVEEHKSQEVILNWIKEKQKSTYVRINEDWRDCDFQYPGWVRE